MKVLIPVEEFDDLSELIPIYVNARKDVWNGRLQRDKLTLSWDVEGVVYIESENLEEVKV